MSSGCCSNGVNMRLSSSGVTQMAKNRVQNSILRRGVVALAATVLTMAVGGQAFAVAPVTLTTEQQSQVAALTTKLLDIAKKLSPTSSEGTFEGAFADAATGYSAEVIMAALSEVAGTPVFPVPQRLRRSASMTNTPTTVTSAGVLARSAASAERHLAPASGLWAGAVDLITSTRRRSSPRHWPSTT